VHFRTGQHDSVSGLFPRPIGAFYPAALAALLLLIPWPSQGCSSASNWVAITSHSSTRPRSRAA
jgi:hypothetical protein